MKPRSLFSLSQKHKDMLRELAAEWSMSMTAHLEKLIEADYKHHDEYQKYLRGETPDPRD